MNFSKRNLDEEVNYLIGLPSRDRRVVKAVINSMINALKRGEKVSIPGFGIFKVKSYKPRKHTGNFFYKRIHSAMISDLPDRKRVLFRPSSALKYMINQEPINGN